MSSTLLLFFPFSPYKLNKEESFILLLEVIKSWASDGRREKTMRSKYPTLYQPKKKSSGQKTLMSSSPQLAHLSIKKNKTNLPICPFPLTPYIETNSTRKLQIPSHNHQTMEFPHSLPWQYRIPSHLLFPYNSIPENYVHWTETPDSHIFSADIPGKHHLN